MTRAPSAPLSALFAHSSWANRIVISALHTDAPHDPELLRLFAHVVAAEHLWLARIRAEAPRVAVWPSLTIDQAESLAMENEARFQELLALDDTALDRVVHYRNSAGREFDNTVRDILMHVALHGQYHRGQIAMRTRAAGGTPAYTDYIGYVRNGR